MHTELSSSLYLWMRRKKQLRCEAGYQKQMRTVDLCTGHPFSIHMPGVWFFLQSRIAHLVQPLHNTLPLPPAQLLCPCLVCHLFFLSKILFFDVFICEEIAMGLMIICWKSCPVSLYWTAREVFMNRYCFWTTCAGLFLNKGYVTLQTWCIPLLSTYSWRFMCRMEDCYWQILGVAIIRDE